MLGLAYRRTLAIDRNVGLARSGTEPFVKLANAGGGVMGWAGITP